jgi:uncharacterized protein (TIGR03086 family)
MQRPPDAGAGPLPDDGQVTDDTTTTQVARLIELGLDRQAATLGAAATTSTPGGPMDPLDQLDALGPILGGVVAGIDSDQLGNPTPCANFDVRGVLAHMISGATAFAAAFRGETTSPSNAAPVDELAAFAPALTNLATAMHEPGALDRTIEAPFGAIDGASFARFVVLDGLVHGWDLSVATGQSYDPPAAVVAAATDFATSVLENLRDGETFAAATEATKNASLIEQLAAYTGRRVPQHA